MEGRRPITWACKTGVECKRQRRCVRVTDHVAKPQRNGDVAVKRHCHSKSDQVVLA